MLDWSLDCIIVCLTIFVSVLYGKIDPIFFLVMLLYDWAFILFSGINRINMSVRTWMWLGWETWYYQLGYFNWLLIPQATTNSPRHHGKIEVTKDHIYPLFTYVWVTITTHELLHGTLANLKSGLNKEDTKNEDNWRKEFWLLR